MMPKISGFEMLDILRNTDGLKNIKEIMLTALGQSDDQEADKLGADKYLVKSQVTLEDIVKVAHELLGDAQPAATEKPVENSAPTPQTPTAGMSAADPAPDTPPPASPDPAVQASPTIPPPIDAAPPTEPVQPTPPSSPEVLEAPAAVTEPPIEAPKEAADSAPESPPPAEPAKEETAQSSSQEEANVEAEIEDFVTGATTDAPPPDPSALPPASPDPAVQASPSPQDDSSTDTQTAAVPPTDSNGADDTAAENAASDDKLMTDAVDTLMSDSGDNTNKPADEAKQSSGTIVVTPSVTPKPVESTDEVDPKADIDSPAITTPKDNSSNVTIAHKKIISPIDGGDKPDIQTLYALEEAKSAAAAPPQTPKAVISDNNQPKAEETIKTESDIKPPDPSSIAL